MRFLGILAAALAVIGGVVFLVYHENQESLVNLEGEILKVRTYELNPNATILIADFRVHNPDQVPFVVDTVQLDMETEDGMRVEGRMLNGRDIDNMFGYEKLAGPKYNEPLLMQDSVPAGEAVDRMAAARIDLPEQEVVRHRNLFLTIEEVDGLVSVITEKPATDDEIKDADEQPAAPE